MDIQNLILSFLAKDAESIKEFVKMPTSKSVYLVMAQALDEKVPPFILQIYGSDAKFTAEDTVRRWHYTKLELEKYVLPLTF